MRTREEKLIAQRAASKRYRLRHPGRAAASTKRWAEAHPERHSATKNRHYAKHAARINARARQWQRDNPREAIISAVKTQAKKKNLPFNLTVASISWPTHCPILGIPLIYRPSGRGERDQRASIDRMIPKLGYVIGNAFVISVRANRLKSDGTLAELEAIVQYMRAHQPEDSPCLSTAQLTP